MQVLQALWKTKHAASLQDKRLNGGGGGGAINTTTNQPSLISKHAKLNVFTTDLTFKSTFNAHSGFEIANLQAVSIPYLYYLVYISEFNSLVGF